MDTDNKIKKALVKSYRWARMRLDYSRLGLLSKESGNKKIAQMISCQDSFMVGRLGAVEMRLVSRWMNGEEYTEEEKERALYAAGIFPNTNEIINQFCEKYTACIRDCDLLSVWEVKGEKEAVKRYVDKATLAPIESLEPYYFKEPWSRELCGKRVLIVHPFVASIEKQLKNRTAIWKNSDVLPEFKSVEYVKAVQSNAGGVLDSCRNWFDALDSMISEIDKKDFEVAIVGAGAYGLPLCSYIKRIGKSAILMAGATQILFGIKGKRWESIPEVSKFFNDCWIRPSVEETPPQISKVEGGTYW